MVFARISAASALLKNPRLAGMKPIFNFFAMLLLPGKL
jgi:hypothetical protein